jgi:superfamily II DNA/RNA helicase
VHGDLGQIAREKSLKAFRSGDIDVLVATDVAARGIDIDDVTHVINYQCPEDDKMYVHRIGRTGRAGRTGIAVTLVDWDELPRWTDIDKALGLGSPNPAETYSNSPHLYAEMGIPTETAGSVGAPRKAPAKRREASSGGGERPPRRTKQRVRTRGGQTASGHSVTSPAANGEAGPDAPAAPSAGSGAAQGSPGSSNRRRRRRRKPADAAAQTI